VDPGVRGLKSCWNENQIMVKVLKDNNNQITSSNDETVPKGSKKDDEKLLKII
jgi:hypothetical protein